jgi:hypothetical protein
MHNPISGSRQRNRMTPGHSQFRGDGLVTRYNVNLRTEANDTHVACCHRLHAILWPIVLCTAVLSSSPVCAAEIFNENGVILRWDNTVTYTAAIRVAGQSAAIISDANSDDGDRDFAPGLVSNRLDVRSEADLALGEFGLHVSGAAWFDTVYHSKTDNHSPSTYNVVGVPSTTFAPAVRDLHGGYVELRDAFGYGVLELGDIPVNVRIGRQTLSWGESLFYDSNAIASAQSPADYSNPTEGLGGYANNPYLPVNQVVLTTQLSPKLSLSLYYQFEWRASRLAGDGSYLSYTDYLGAGAGRLFLPDGRVLLRRRGPTPPQQGQYGAAFNITWGDAGIGLYALTYTSKDPQVVTSTTGVQQDAGFYTLVYPTQIVLTGASFSAYIEDSAVAGELSFRQNMPLALYPFPAHQSVDLSHYVKGTLMHVQLSDVVSFARTDMWDAADLATEMVADDVLDTEGPSADSAHLDRFAMKLRVSFLPQYFQALPNLDLSIPVEIGYNIAGHSFDAYQQQNAGTGELRLGLAGTYVSVWKAEASFSYFIGSTYNQPLADRTFVSLRFERTF